MPGKIVSNSRQSCPYRLPALPFCPPVSVIFPDLARLKRHGILRMMKLKTQFAAPFAVACRRIRPLASGSAARAQNSRSRRFRAAPRPPRPLKPAPAAAAPKRDRRANAHARPLPGLLHLALAGSYEGRRCGTGPAGVRHPRHRGVQAALNADPTSPQLNNGLADLYFRTGRVRDAEVTARPCSKARRRTSTPTNCWAASICASWAKTRAAFPPPRPPANVLDLAIAEFEKDRAPATQKR